MDIKHLKTFFQVPVCANLRHSAGIEKDINFKYFIRIEKCLKKLYAFLCNTTFFYKF